jgi:hypothetical protein
MADFHLSIGSTGFGAAGVAFGATGSACFSGAAGPAGSSTNRLKQISLSSSSFKAAIVNDLGWSRLWLGSRPQDRVIANQARHRHVLEFKATPQFLQRRLCLSHCVQSGD